MRDFINLFSLKLNIEKINKEQITIALHIFDQMIDATVTNKKNYDLSFSMGMFEESMYVQGYIQ